VYLSATPATAHLMFISLLINSLKTTLPTLRCPLFSDDFEVSFVFFVVLYWEQHFSLVMPRDCHLITSVLFLLPSVGVVIGVTTLKSIDYNVAMTFILNNNNNLAKIAGVL